MVQNFFSADLIYTPHGAESPQQIATGIDKKNTF